MIHASEARLRAVLRASRDATLVFDREGTIRFVAPAAEELFGLLGDELIERSFWDLVHPVDLAAGLAEIARGFDVSRTATVEWRVLAAHGEWRWIEQTLTDLSDNPAVAGVLSQLRDVADRRALEEALEESEARFHEIFAQQPMGAAFVDPDMAPVAVNEALCRMLGYAPEELIGRPFAEYTHPDDLGDEMNEVARLISGEIDRYRIDKRFLRRDGSELVGRLTGWLVRDDVGEIQYGVATVEDVTEQVRTRELLQDRERHLRLALSAAGISIWDLDLRTGVAHVFSSSPVAVPVGSGELVTTAEHLLAVLHPDDRPTMRRVVEGDDPTQDEFDFDCRIRPRSASEPRWAHVKGQVLRDRQGVATRISGITVDVDDRRRAEAQRLEAAEVFRQTVAASNDGFLGIDGDGRIVAWNPAAERLLGYPAAEAIGADAVELLVPPRAHAALSAAIGRLIDTLHQRTESKGFGPVELQILHRSGREILVEASGARVEQGDAALLHVFLRDATERSDVVQQLENGLLTDPLTSLPNRALLTDRLSSALARLERSPGMVAVLFLDLDRFKVVNDALGHAAGDSLLATIAARIRRALRPQDTVARFGGDEFVVVVEDIHAVEDILVMAERLVVEIGGPVIVRDHEFHLGVSIGIAVATDADADAATMIRDADLAMYRAKNRGGSTAELFDDDMRRAVMARLELEADLRRAVEADEFEVYYQPVVHLDGSLAGVEALVRWHHPTRGLINPAEFIPVAEETGLITAIGAQVLEQACTAVARWRQHLEPGLHLSVNLSVRQLTDGELPAVVEGILQRSGLAAEALCLELTETALMRDAVVAGSTLHRLRAMGVSLAVDDFGTGYSSLLYLRRFPVQALKLDRYFVAGVADEDEDRVIIGAIVELARALGLNTVAEGVEREDQRVALAELGCDYAQGHLFGRAVPAPVLEQVLRGPEGLTAAAAVPAAPAPARSGVPVLRLDDSGRRPYRAFVVDDSPGDRSLLRAMLEGSGEFTVVGEAESADEALAAVAAAQPDVVLTDLFLPGTDGLELLEDLGRVAPEAKAVIVSGFVSDGVSVAAHAAGALACLDKSLSATSMVDTLTSLLAGRRQAAS